MAEVIFVHYCFIYFASAHFGLVMAKVKRVSLLACSRFHKIVLPFFNLILKVCNLVHCETAYPPLFFTFLFLRLCTLLEHLKVRKLGPIENKGREMTNLRKNQVVSSSCLPSSL